MSNHHHTREELGRLGKEIEAGQPVTYDRAALALNERILECLEADPDAFQCTRCGEDVDWFGDTLCPECKANKE